MKDPKRLIEAQDLTFADKTLWPSEGDTTYCNLAALRVAHGMGCHDLDGSGKVPYLANQLYELMRESDRFLVKVIGDCQELVNAGTLIFAILPGSRLNAVHGHVCTLTPGPMDFSGHWDIKTPLCMNLGRVGTCFRAKGVNWAFQTIPEFYAWKESL